MRNPQPDQRRTDPNHPRLAGFVRSLPADRPEGEPSTPRSRPAAGGELDVDGDAEARMESEGGPPPATSGTDAGRDSGVHTGQPSARAGGGRPVTTKKNIDDTVHALNGLLQGELAAVETYNEALPALRATNAASRLDECQASHQRRVLALRAEILERGGEPATTPGAWGTFAKLFEKGARVLGPKMALNALEAGEDHGLKEYAGILGKLDMPARSTITADFYPEQVRTHRIVSDLKHQMNATG